MAIERIGCVWQSILTTGDVKLGVHIETVPFEWPQQRTAFLGFWHMTSSLPRRVWVCWTIFPIETSSQAKVPISFCKKTNNTTIKRIWKITLRLRQWPRWNGMEEIPSWEHSSISWCSALQCPDCRRCMSILFAQRQTVSHCAAKPHRELIP